MAIENPGSSVSSEVFKHLNADRSESSSNGNNPQAAPAPANQFNQQSWVEHCGQDGLPCIQLSGDIPLRSLSDQSMAALRTRNKRERFIYQRAGKLVYIRTIDVVDNQGRPNKKTVIDEVSQDTLRGMLTRSINFVRVGRNGQTTHVDPPPNLVKDILAKDSWPVPVIVSVTEVPTLRADGSILDTPGYDRATGMVYQPNPDLSIPAIPEYPTREDAVNAVAVIMEAIADFPYDSDASEANTIAGMLTPIVRPALSGHVPLELIDATRAGTGKSLLSDIVAYSTTGRKAAFKTAPENNAEWRKTITSTLLEGTAINIIDNVRSKLDSQALDALITAPYWSDRLLSTR